jgi:hypothetical protein
VRTSVFGERIEQIDLLPLRCAPSAGQVEVLLLDVQDDDGFLVFEEIRDDYADAFARTGGCGEDDELLPGEANDILAEFTYNYSVGGIFE